MDAKSRGQGSERETDAAPTVFIVDDDAAVRSALGLLVASCGWRARVCASAEEFLSSYEREPGCLLLDLQMQGMSGPELQRTLTSLGIDLPVIVVTAFPDHQLAHRAIARGARAVIAKPFRDNQLIEEIRTALG